MRHLASRASAIVALAVIAGALAACASPEPDIAAIEFPDASGAVAVAPGADLAFGDAAWLPIGEQQAAVGLAVLGIVAGDPEDWPDIVANPEAFAGETPYYVEYQYAWPTAAERGVTAYLIPVAADGAEGSRVEDADGTPIPCPLTVETFEDRPDVGLGCFVVLAPAGGAPVTGVRWFDIDASTPYQPTPEETPYYAQPVTWGAASLPSPTQSSTPAA